MTGGGATSKFRFIGWVRKPARANCLPRQLLTRAGALAISVDRAVPPLGVRWYAACALVRIADDSIGRPPDRPRASDGAWRLQNSRAGSATAYLSG